MRRGGGRHRFTLIGRKFPPQAGCMNIHEWGGHGKLQQSSPRAGNLACLLSRKDGRQCCLN